MATSLGWYRRRLAALGQAFGFTTAQAINTLTDRQYRALMHGTETAVDEIEFKSSSGRSRKYTITWEGVMSNLDRRYKETESEWVRSDIERYMVPVPCDVCRGARLKPEVQAVTVDGKHVDFADTVTFRGMMFTGLPNLVWVFGYFRASWTLRADLVADFVCRLLRHMKVKGAARVEVALRPEDRDMKLLPWIDSENFNPGYLMRGMHLLPKRGDKREWQHTQDYWREKNEFPKIDLDDKAFVYAPATVKAAAS